jgi:predicted Rossmann-fold nucleotide-binding protein
MANLFGDKKVAERTGPTDRGSCLRSHERTIRILEHHSLQALLVAAGNNASLFLSNRQSQSSSKHEPNDPASIRNHFEGQRIFKLYRHYRDKHLMCVNGTSSDRAVPSDIVDFLDKLAHAMVEIGVGHICGGAETGSMGAGIRSWIRANRELGKNIEIATVLLKLNGSAADREKPLELEGWGMQSVKQWSWSTRTPALHGIGRQAAMGINPGGLGTLFEVFFPIAARQFQSKGIVGIFDEQRSPSELFFFSSSTYESHFWEPTANLFKNMVMARACKPEYLQCNMIDPGDSEIAIKKIVELHEKERLSEHKSPRKSLSNPERKFATTALSSLSRAGFEPRDSFHNSSRPFFSFLDNLVAAHRVIYHLRKGLKILTQQGADEAANYLDDSIQGAQDERSLTLTTLERLAKKPAIQLVGSAKENIWNEQIESYSKRIISTAVRNGLSVVISGCGTVGMPKHWTDIWINEMKLFQDASGKPSQSELVRVQTSYEGKEEPKRTFERGYAETVITLLTLDARNEVANAIGSKQAFILAPGGPAELLAFSQAILNRQLFGKMLTPYAEKPIFEVLNVPVGQTGSERFYDPLLEQLKVMERYYTINPSDYSIEWFKTLENPILDADRLIADLTDRKM